MSIADKIVSLTTARNNIRVSLVDKGVNASDHGFEDFATDIGNIPVFDPDDYAVAIYEVPDGEEIEPDPSEFITFSNIQTDGTTSSVVNTRLKLFSPDFICGFIFEMNFDNVLDESSNAYRRIFGCEQSSSPYPGFNLTRKQNTTDVGLLSLNSNGSNNQIEFQILSTGNTIYAEYDAINGEYILRANGQTLTGKITPFVATDTVLSFGGQIWSNSTSVASDRCTKVNINSVIIKPKKREFNLYRNYLYVGKDSDYIEGLANISIIEVQLPITPSRIGNSTFSGNTKMKHINLEHVTYVGRKAFEGCTSIVKFDFKNVTYIDREWSFNSSNSYVYDAKEILLPKVESILTMFPNGIQTPFPNLRLIDISGAVSIPEQFISNNRNKTDLKIKLGTSVETIGQMAFKYNDYTIIGNDDNEINLPNLTSLGQAAFFHTGIKKVTNLGSITSIGNNTFRECYNLTFVRIPSTVTTIGNAAFLEYHSGMVMVVEAITPPSTPSAPTVDAVYVPDESVDNYKAASGWSQIASKIHPLSEYTGTD